LPLAIEIQEVDRGHVARGGRLAGLLLHSFVVVQLSHVQVYRHPLAEVVHHAETQKGLPAKLDHPALCDHLFVELDSPLIVLLSCDPTERTKLIFMILPCVVEVAELEARFVFGLLLHGGHGIVLEGEVLVQIER